MCLRNIYYPLVRLDTGKRKILFNYGVKIENREAFQDMIDIRHQCILAKHNLSKYKSLNKLFVTESIVDLDKMVQVPCGCCRECMDDISRQWAFRILQEASLYDNNYFVTFTYNEENIPKDKMLVNDFYTSFNKKLRTYLNRDKLNSKFRFYGIGEYGSKGARPHYHCIYFNLDIPDLKYEYTDKKGFLHFSSKFLESVYCKEVEVIDKDTCEKKKVSQSIGFVDIGCVDVGSACYVARYCEKKRRLNKSEKEEYIKQGVVPEFSRMSNKPGIGANALDDLTIDFENGIFKHFIKGKSYSLPLYYSRKIKELLEGTEILKTYEENCKMNSMSKINEYLYYSDRCDLNSHLKDLDVVKKRNL